MLLTGETFNWSARGLFPALYTGAFEMGITFFIWLKALKLTSSTGRISRLVFLAPFISLIFVHLILHEQIFYTTFIGIVFIVSGILVQNLDKTAKPV
jgi:drug/metabolite transporter (DMT)-like permease